MGRARSQTQAATTDSFDSVVGARRGSPAAQAARDADEQAVLVARAAAEERERVRREAEELAVFASARSDFAAAVGGASGERLMVETLTIAYDEGEYEDKVLYGQLVDALVEDVTWSASELTAIAAVGDPVSMPGLTAPAVSALNRYFSDITWAEGSKAENISYHVMMILEAYAQDSDVYERLLPLCQGFAAVLAQTQEPEEDFLTLGLQMVGIIEKASPEALAGPLRCWLEVLAQRLKDDKSGVGERNVLKRIADATTVDPTFASVFADIVMLPQLGCWSP
jgi:hypothetical protein